MKTLFMMFIAACSICLGGCVRSTEATCVNGVQYWYTSHGNVTLLVDRDGKPIPCESSHG